MSVSAPLPLSEANLSALASRVRVPSYARSAIRVGIVHIGVGGFHRAHQAVYMDDLLHRTGNESFGICGVGLLPHDQRMAEVMAAQDRLYTLVVRSAAGDEPRVIGSIVDFLHAPADPEAVIERMASEQTRIVSLTVTESGYCENKATGQLDAAHPAIVHDLAQPHQPRGVYGYLAEALERRRQRGLMPFTIMSCDNLLNNGNVCRRMLLAFLERRDASLAKWVEENAAFPNSMVDRITPATTDEHRALVRDKFGIADAWPVTTEPFLQWVIEDHFPLGRPAWESVGAQIVESVEPYEKMKIRLLNGSHQVMCYIGMLLGHRFAPQAMNDELIRLLITRFMDNEVTPLLPAVPGIDLEDYKRTLRDRFANPAINDQLARIGTDGAARVAEFVVPTITEQLQRGGPIDVGAFTVAAWIRFLLGRDDAGVALPPNDARTESLRTLAESSATDAAAILAMHDLFGDVGTSPRFVGRVNEFLGGFARDGARPTLDQLTRSADTRG